MFGIRFYVLLLICLGFVGVAVSASYGQAVTTTTLSALPTGTVASGTVVPLVAAVSDTSGPVLAGQVTFFDGTKILGAVPIVRVATAGGVPGTATLRKIFGPGNHSVQAVYNGTASEQSSTSSIASLTVAAGTSTPSTGLVYGGTRYFEQLTGLSQVIVTDINNDGVLDLVAPQFDIGSSVIAISLGDPSNPGTFLPPTFVTGTTNGVNSVTAGDLNGDGLIDLVVSDIDNGYTIIFFQDPAHPGTFLSGTFINSVGNKAQIADMNHDGVPDLILFPQDAQNQTAEVMIFPGDPQNPGNFLAPITYSLDDESFIGSAIADMNGDGLMDIVLANNEPHNVTVILNDPTQPGHLLPRSDFSSGGNSGTDLAIGDMNGDGVPDVVLNGGPSGVTILLGDAGHPGQLLTPVNYPVTPTPGGGSSLSVAIGDINGDGIPDVVSGNFGNVFDLLLGRGDGTLQATVPYSTGPTADTFEAESMAVADLDGDGLVDVVVGQARQNSAQIFLHQTPTPAPLVITATDMSVSQTIAQVGHTVTVTVKVSSTNGPPPGSVTLYSDIATNGNGQYAPTATLTLDSTGAATYTTEPLPHVTYDFFTFFPGDSVYAPSTSLIDQVVVIPGPVTALSLTAGPNPAASGQTVAFTATIALSGPAPSGNIMFADTGNMIGSVPLAGSNSVVFNTGSLLVGTHTIQASYNGDANYSSQTATITAVVLPLTVTTLDVSPNPANTGQTVTLKASVTGSGHPAGAVTFLDGTTTIGTANLDATGTAVLTTTTLSVGTHPLTATFAANSTGAASSSAVVNEVIATVPPPDYTLSTNTPLTIGSSHQGSAQLTVTPSGGLDDTITLSCGSLPAYVTCAITPAQAKVNGGNPQNATVNIATNSAPAMAMVRWRDGIVLAGLLPGLLLGISAGRRSLARGLIMILLLTIAGGEMIGCGGSGNSSGSTSNSNITPPGTYQIVIQGNGMSTGLTHTTTLTLIVTQ